MLPAATTRRKPKKSPLRRTTPHNLPNPSTNKAASVQKRQRHIKPSMRNRKGGFFWLALVPDQCPPSDQAANPLRLGAWAPEPYPASRPTNTPCSDNQRPHRPPQALPTRRPKTHQRDVVGLRMPSGELTNILKNRPSHGDRSARLLRHSLDQPVVGPRVVKLIARAARPSPRPSKSRQRRPRLAAPRFARKPNPP